MLCQIAVLCVLLWIIIDDWKRRKVGKSISSLPRSKTRSYPIIGQAYKFIGNNEDIMTSLQEVGAEANACGGALRFWFGQDPVLVITDAEIAGIILKTCMTKADTIKAARTLTENGSIFAPVSIWRPRRKILGRALNSKVLRNFVPVFARQSATAAARLRRACGAGPVALWKYLTAFTLDSVCETNLGVSLSAQRHPDQHMLRAFEGAFRLVGARLCQPWLQPDAVYRWLPQHAAMERHKRTLFTFIEEIIAEKKYDKCKKSSSENNEEMNSNKIKTFMEILLEAEGMSDKEVREECLVMALAGTDTSAIGACSTILMMAKHPEVQEKVYKEIRETLAKDGAITAEHLPKLRYLDAVIKETMRLYPPVPTIGRKIDCPTKITPDVTLAPGITILVNIWSLHRNPVYWGSNAEQFRPERFLGSTTVHPTAYIPFSYGPRNCIGSTYAMISIKTVVSALTMKYRFLPTGDEKMRLKFEITMKDVDNYIVRIETR